MRSSSTDSTATELVNDWTIRAAAAPHRLLPASIQNFSTGLSTPAVDNRARRPRCDRAHGFPLKSRFFARAASARASSSEVPAPMKILVGYKRVVDFNVRIQVKPDGSGVVTDGVKLSANPFDDIALEEALRLRDKGVASEVVLVTIGPADAQAHIRNGLAMGANRAIHVVTAEAIQPLTAARVLRQVIDKEQPGLVLLGKQAIDDDCNQTGQMLAALWDRPQATFASKVEVNGASARVTREIDAGLETIDVDLPAVITTDLRLNEPRFIKLPDIMKAKSKPIETIELASLGVASGDHLKTTHYAPPAKRSKGVMVKDVAELVAALKAKGLV